MHRLLHALSGPYARPTHPCGALSPVLVGAPVVLAGCLLPERTADSIRKSFFRLADDSGDTQLLVDHHTPAHALLRATPTQSAVLVSGHVVPRPPAAIRPGPTGAVDVLVHTATVLNPATAHLPFLPHHEHTLPTDDVRARYRVLDLRRPSLAHNLKQRSNVARSIRTVLYDHDFTEVETPILLRSSPEGAREFLVPARPHSPHSPLFYALSQSPQQPKQLLICSGAVSRYFQFARCFRDEDGRKDRQPEFTQVDLEMAFVDWHPDHPISDNWAIGGSQVRSVVESLIRAVWRDSQSIHLDQNFDVITYREAMAIFGSDKPDTRFGLKIINLSDSHVHNPTHNTHTDDHETLPSATPDLILEAIPIRQSGEFINASRESILLPHTERIIITPKNANTWLQNSKTFAHVNHTHFDLDALYHTLELKPGDHIWLSYRTRIPKGSSTPLGKIRTLIFEIAQASAHNNIIPTSNPPHFLWVTEFPLFTRSDQDKDEHLAKGRWSSTHHPFTAPVWEDVPALWAGEVEKVRGQHYDLVLNGVEIGGGSVRIHDPLMQDFVFTEILKLTEKEKSPFAQLLHALASGAPPHGGIALGFDRLMSILCKTSSIRDVIAFPKSAQGTDLLFKSPASVDEGVLERYGLRSRVGQKNGSGNKGASGD